MDLEIFVRGSKYIIEEYKVMYLTVVIVNWNTENILRNCLSSIKSMTSGIIYEVIVVDNASDDRSCQMVSEEFPEFILVPNKVNLGFSKANNIGLGFARGKYILFLNPDTELKTNALKRMVDFLENNPKYGAVGPKLLNRDGTIQYTCARTFPTLLNQFHEIMMFHLLFPKSKVFETVELMHWDHNNSREVECISGACIMVRRDMVECLGGFEEDYFMYAEDVSLCYNIRKLGYKIFYLSTEEVLHLSGSSSNQRSKQYFSAIMIKESNYLFMRKHYGKYKAAIFKIIVAIGSLFRMLTISIFSMVSIITKRNIVPAKIFQKYYYIFLWSVNGLDIEKIKK